MSVLKKKFLEVSYQLQAFERKYMMHYNVYN